MFCDNISLKEYSYSDNSTNYNGEFVCDSLLEYVKEINVESIEKGYESYCDGEKNYYWTNPINNPNDSCYSHWNKYTIPHEGDAEKYDGFDKFRSWNITGEINLSGRDCCIVEDKIDFVNDEMCIYPEDYYGSYKFFIDKETGIPIGREFYDKDGKTVQCSIYYDIRLNNEAEPVPDVDISGYNFTFK